MKKKIVFELPQEQHICDICGDALAEYTEEYITTRLAVIPEKVYKIEYYRKVYKCKNCDKNGIKANNLKAENKTPACIIKKGLPDASLVADIMQRKYQFGEPLYRQGQYWKLRGILFASRASSFKEILCVGQHSIRDSGREVLADKNIFKTVSQYQYLNCMY